MNRWRKITKFCLRQSLRAQPPYGRTQAQVAPCSRSKLSGALWWRSGKKKESLQLRLWNLNVCVEKVDTKCWLAEMTLVMTSLPWHAFFNVCLHSRLFPLCADWRKSNCSVDGEPQGNWRWNSSPRDVVASSPFFYLPAARAPRRACSQATRGSFLMLKTLNHTHTITLKRTGSMGVSVNWPPTPLLSHNCALREKQVLMLTQERGRWSVTQRPQLIQRTNYGS